ncbi:hypothetical protein M422DRAFT_66865 [Sphaerobolus stellatus SS14]|uniref:F-box domain-containing protein n=1 Tax=Sphaerobolus stellatus (strain SS14) TaxID=990650 RepID=A0A0C9UTA7_SPHS4|nr:hypothetical protein M422DRAFT_66865 [Sphaerobolus stellatus SS14]
MPQRSTLSLDVWLTIMDELEGWDLFVLASTCREFRRLALPKAYHTVVFTAPSYPETVDLSDFSTGTEGLDETLEELQDVMDRVIKLQQNTNRLQYIQCLHLDGWGFLPGEIAYSQAVYEIGFEEDGQELIWEAKGRFERGFEDILRFARGLPLQYLLLNGCIITPEVLDVISNVNGLRKVHIRSYLNPFKLWDNIDHYPPVHHVRELRLSTLGDAEPENAKTHLLLLLCSSLKILEIPLQGISNMDTKIFPVSCLPQLEDLFLLRNLAHPGNYSSLGWLLRSSPNLRRLTMDCIPINSHLNPRTTDAYAWDKQEEQLFASVLSEFPGETFPRLEFVNAPMAFTRMLLHPLRLMSLRDIVVQFSLTNTEQKLTEFAQYLAAILPRLPQLRMERPGDPHPIPFKWVSIFSNYLYHITQLHLMRLEEIEGDRDSVEILRSLLEMLRVFPLLQVCTVEWRQSFITNTSVGLTYPERIHGEMKYICLPGRVLWAWIENRGWCIVEWPATIKELSVWSMFNLQGKGVYHKGILV